MPPTSLTPGAVAVKSRGHQIRDRRLVALHRRCRPVGGRLAGPQVLLAHELADQLVADVGALAGKLNVHAAVAVGLIAVVEICLIWFLGPRGAVRSARSRGRAIRSSRI
jgi:hypothetical protein